MLCCACRLCTCSHHNTFVGISAFTSSQLPSADYNKDSRTAAYTASSPADGSDSNSLAGDVTSTQQTPQSQKLPARRSVQLGLRLACFLLLRLLDTEEGKASQQTPY